MKDNEYIYLLGKLIVAFHGLEFSLRAFLQNQPGVCPMGIPAGTKIYDLPVGATIPENMFSSYDTLGALISKYNKVVSALGRPTIDQDLVELRDALAHGRVASMTETGPMNLIKFSKPQNGQVKVVFKEIMDTTWFNTQISKVNRALWSIQNDQS